MIKTKDLLIVLLFSLFVGVLTTGCKPGEVDANINFPDRSYISHAYEVFEGVSDGATVYFRYGEGQYTCNPADNLVYEFDTNAAYLNADTTQATCTTDIVTRFDVSEQDPPYPVIEI